MKLKRFLLNYIHFLEIIHSYAWNQNIEKPNRSKLSMFIFTSVVHTREIVEENVVSQWWEYIKIGTKKWYHSSE